MPDQAPAALLRQRVEQQYPDAIVATVSRAAAPATPAKKGEPSQVNLLATDDLVVQPQAIPAVARLIRDELGFALLTNLTAIDYLADQVIEVAYHFANLRGGAPLVLKTRLPRSEPRVPSLTPWWPGADFQEREAFDLFGVEFEGHPRLRRIYMWDEFEGFPMRKDFPKHGDKYFGDTGEG
ncbi:MAG: NADH-quinone oxidoreductase subunit C [Roseiflexaceae bacterium]